MPTRRYVARQSGILPRISGLLYCLVSFVQFYSTQCLKFDAFFHNVFELNAAEHKRFLISWQIRFEQVADDWNRANAEICCKAKWHSFMYFWFIILFSEYCAHFILQYAWMKLDALFHTVFELNAAEHKRLLISRWIRFEKIRSKVWIHTSCTKKAAWTKTVNWLFRCYRSGLQTKKKKSWTIMQYATLNWRRAVEFALTRIPVAKQIGILPTKV